MNKHFYSHLIEVDSIYIKLNLLDLTTEEQQELITIVESSIHHVVIDTILSELEEEDKKAFLSHVALENHTDIWNLLTKKIDNVEKKIQLAIDALKEELHKDIEEAKKKRVEKS